MAPGPYQPRVGPLQISQNNAFLFFWAFLVYPFGLHRLVSSCCVFLSVCVSFRWGSLLGLNVFSLIPLPMILGIGAAGVVAPSVGVFAICLRRTFEKRK